MFRGEHVNKDLINPYCDIKAYHKLIKTAKYLNDDTFSSLFSDSN